MKQENGFILKGIGGFYYVRTDSGVIECKARGKFRKSSQKPVIGDRVMIEVQDDGTGYIMSIEPRKNRFIRPAVSNIDQLVIVDRKSTRLNSSHSGKSRMPSSA